MPRESTPQLSNTHERDVNAATASAGSTPEAEVTPTVPQFPQGIHERLEILATRCVVQSDGIQPAANLAARMAPEDHKSLHLNRLDDNDVHRLINALGKATQGALEKKINLLRSKPECL
ncbi:MAG: hypothetical protein ACLQVG_22995 [Terriglobia bacterium]